MLRAFSTAATGMQAQQMVVDVIANNLANINTSGYKRSQVEFQDLMSLKLSQAGSETASGVTSPTGVEIGNGVSVGATTRVYSQGEMSNTDRDLDVAIEGDGFFAVTTPSGTTKYTRDGSFHVDASGNLVTSQGYSLSPAITIPTDYASLSIGTDGTVSTTASDGTSTAVGTITLVRFSNPAGLTAEGGNLLAETAASGSPLTGTAGADGYGTIQQGYLESSNVQMVTELVNLITAQRAYEINSRAIKAGDEMLTTANQLVS